MKVIPTKVANFFTNLVKDTIRTRKEKKIVRPDMIHLLLEAQKGHQNKDENMDVDEGFSTVSESEVTKQNQKKEITDQDIISQALIFFLAGFDTVSTLLTYVAYELAINPEIQKRLKNEIQQLQIISHMKISSN